MTPEQLEQAGRELTRLRFLEDALDCANKGGIAGFLYRKQASIDDELKERLYLVITGHLDAQLALTKARLADLGVTLDQC